MSELNINLCQEILNEAKKLEIKEKGIKAIQDNPIFIQAYVKHYGLQRTMLTTMLFKLLLITDFTPPPEIRIALSAGNDVLSWLSDIKLVVLPFIKANEDKYFPD